jgi:hypothetical protein
VTRRVSRASGAAALAAAVLITSCTAVQAVPPSPGGPGFLLGFWHGFIAPIAFIVSVFSETVRIYAVPNTGVWYDFGFMLGISGFSGGAFAGSRGKGTQKSRRKKNGNG